MDRETLRKLELLNQLSLDEKQKTEVIAFCEERAEDAKLLLSVNTENTEPMVHVRPIYTVIREDVVDQPFSREELQKGAPETDEGYWCVPRVVE